MTWCHTIVAAATHTSHISISSGQYNCISRACCTVFYCYVDIWSSTSSLSQRDSNAQPI